MKKIFTIVFGLVLAAGASAQVTWGIKAGVNGNLVTNGKFYFEENPRIVYEIDAFLGRFDMDCTPEPIYGGGLDYPCGESVTEGQLMMRSSNVIPKVSFHAGLFLEYMINPRMGVQAEAVYSRQGAFILEKARNRRYDRTDLKLSAWLQLDYVNIPLLFKYYVIPKRLSIDVGPQIGILASSNLKLKVVTQNSNTERYNEPVNANPVDISMVAGISYKFAYLWHMSLRETVSITPALKRANSNGTQLNMMGLQFSLGHKF